MKSVREEERPTLLLMAAGAVAGAAAGLYLGRRYRSMDAFLDDMKDRFGDLRALWLRDEIVDDERVHLAREAALEEDEDHDVDVDELEDEEFDDLYHSATLRDDEEDAFVEEDEDDGVDEDEDLDDELSTIAADNGASDVTARAEEKAMRLERRVLEELRDEPVLGSRPIEIAVVGDGVVELTGAVHAIDEVSRAAALVRDVPGVSMVLNRIEVRTGGHLDTASVPKEPVEGT